MDVGATRFGTDNLIMLHYKKSNYSHMIEASTNSIIDHSNFACF